MTPLYFASGASSIADLRGFARILHPFGVSLPELSAPAMAVLVQLGHLALPVFVDTAAFSEVDATPAGLVVTHPISEAGWATRMEQHRVIATALGSHAYVVAPDRVGDQAVTLARLERWAVELRHLRALGARVIVPIQQGAQEPAAFDRAAMGLLGFDDYVRAIPSNKDAMPTWVLARFLDQAKPAAVHLLGCGPKNQRFAELVATCQRAVPGAALSCDSNPLAALVGRSNGRGGGPRRLTAWEQALRADGRQDVRAPAIVMTFGPELFYRKAMEAYLAAGLAVRRPRAPEAQQIDLFTGSGDTA